MSTRRLRISLLTIWMLALTAFVLFGPRTRAQNTTFSIQIAPGTTSANCSVVALQTTYCFTGGGTIYVSVNGAAFAALVPAAGVTSVTVCNASGASCGTAQTGAVQIDVPKSATVVVTAPTASATLQ